MARAPVAAAAPAARPVAVAPAGLVAPAALAGGPVLGLLLDGSGTGAAFTATCVLGAGLAAVTVGRRRAWRVLAAGPVLVLATVVAAAGPTGSWGGSLGTRAGLATHTLTWTARAFPTMAAVALTVTAVFALRAVHVDGPVPPRHAGRPAPRRHPVLGPLGRLTAMAATAALLLTCGTGWYAVHALTSGVTTSQALALARRHGPASGRSTPAAPDRSVNILLIGLDSRKDMNGNDLPTRFVEDDLHAGSSDIGGYNTNTLILLHVPADGGRVQAVSIPRDDYVETFDGDGSSQGMHKIKEAYGLAKAAATPALEARHLSGAALEAAGREAGRAATLVTVENFLGVRIDHFAEVNLLGFYDLAAVLQPITVCLNHATSDPAMQGQGSGASFHAGLNVLDAAQALSFVRQRHNLTGGDLDRTHRQQAFLSAAAFKLKQDGVLSDLGKLSALFDVVRKDVVIDDGWNVLDFARQAPDLTGGRVVFNTLPINGFATRGGESVNLVDPAQIRTILVRLTTPAPPASPATSSPRPSAAGSSPGPSASSSTGGAARSSAAPIVFQGPTVVAGGIPCVN